MTFLKVGDKAPDFTLKDQNGKEIKLSEAKGKTNVLLSFHPLAWTGVCEIQMRTLELKASELRKLDTIAMGISVDPVPGKKAWADKLGIEHTLFLSDFWPHGRMSNDYGLFMDEMGVSARANILVDKEGVIKFVRVYPMKEVPDIEEVIKELK